MERFYSLKSIKGPKEQMGIVLRSTSRGLLEDITGMLSLKKIEKNCYRANTNVDIFGKKIGEEDIIKLVISDNAEIKIHQQADYPMFLEEIDKRKAREIQYRFKVKRTEAIAKPKSLTRDSPDLSYYL